MKKLLTVLLMVLMAFSLMACSRKEEEAVPEQPQEPETGNTETGVMTYEEFLAADLDSPVAIISNVQAVQSYYNGATFYLQDPEGAYFVYGSGDVPNISEAEYAKIAPSTTFADGWTGLCDGTQVMVVGVKSEWSGEVEIIDANVIILDGAKWVADPLDVTDKLGSNELSSFMNYKVAFKDMTVEAYDDQGNAFNYNYDGSGEPGNDLYFKVSKDGNTYTFTVEQYLAYDGSEVYEAVENLKVGDVVDLEGFLYWYNGANPHITSVVVK